MCITHIAIIAPETVEVKNNVDKMHHLELKFYKFLLPSPRFDKLEASGLRTARAWAMKAHA